LTVSVDLTMRAKSVQASEDRSFTHV